jgi:hypothetical protein
MLVALWAG